MPPSRLSVRTTGLALLDAFGAEHLGGLGEAVADDPVRGGAQAGEPRLVGGVGVQRGQEPDLLQVRRVRLDQVVARHAQVAHELHLVVLEVLEAAPHQVGRLHRGEPGEVAAVDHRDPGTARRQRGGRNGAVDATAHHQYVEGSAVQAGDVAVT